MKILVILATVAIITIIVFALANKIKHHKVISVSLFMLLIVIISIFTSIQRNTEKQHAKIINLFNRDKTIICNGLNVIKKDFNFISGTLVFIGKEESDFKAQIISLDECEISNTITH